STLGTAGFKREIAIVAKINPSAEAAMIMMRRLRFFAATPWRGTSMEERFGVNPAGRTIVPSFCFRCGVTVESKRSERATELEDRGHSAHQGYGCGDAQHCEQNRFAEEIMPGFALKVLPADITKRCGGRACATGT